jgi:hypothetical protein
MVHAVLSVSDTGCGMSEEFVRESLFVPSSVVIELPYSPLRRIFDLHRAVATDHIA